MSSPRKSFVIPSARPVLKAYFAEVLLLLGGASGFRFCVLNQLNCILSLMAINYHL